MILPIPETHTRILPAMPRFDQGPVKLAANKKEQEFHDALAGALRSAREGEKG